MNGLSCDECGASTDLDHQFDFCWHCGRDLCDKCAASVGCCGKTPATSGTGRANALYRVFGSSPPKGAVFEGEDDG